MSDLECPYCDHGFEFDDESPSQDEKLEIECPSCEKNFIAYANWSLSFTEYQADCLNDEDHRYKDSNRYPFVIDGKVQQRCEMCDEEKCRDATEAEMNDPKLNWEIIKEKRKPEVSR